MKERMDRLYSWMEKEGLDALLVSNRYNVRYLSGFTGDMAYLYISKKQKLLMTDSRYTTWARAEAEGFSVFQVDAKISYADKLGQLLEEEQAGNIGFENQKMIYADVLKFQKKAPETTEWISVDGRLDQLRQIKNAGELACIARAEAIGDAAFSHIIKTLSVGMTEQETAWELEDVMRREGADGLSFETIAVFGERTAMPHAVPGKRKLAVGDFVVMDFGCIYEGYCSDMTRTVIMGKADSRQKDIYDTVLQAQAAALSMIRSGLRCCDVDAAARKVIADAGYGEYFGHGLGHSVGLYIHESPALSPKDTSILQENMLETVEPGIYIPDFGGVRIEDLVVVQRDGCENLTHSEKKLLELGEC